MSGWRERRQELLDGLKYLPAVTNASSASSEEQLHLTLLAAEQDKRDPPTPLKRIRGAALTLDDFPPLSTLSSSGSFSRVELVRPSSALTGDENSRVGRVYVMKTLDRRWAFRMKAQQSPQHELAILRLGRTKDASNRIPRLIVSFLSPTSFHIVISHASGGDLWTLLEKANEGVAVGEERGLSEDWVRGWMAQLLNAVDWLHGKGWAHRDIKPQNLLLDAPGHLQLTDFGSAAPLSRNSSSIARKNCRALVGTPDYIAPEVLRHAEKVFQEAEEEDAAFGAGPSSAAGNDEKRAYGAEVDVWSCGVVLYELLYGKAPFFAEEIADTYEHIVQWQNHLTFPTTDCVSSAAVEAMRCMLVDPSSRPSFAKLKSFPWFAKVDWAKLRETTPAYIPPPAPSDLPSSPSFARSQAFSASSIDFSSFFSSPGLSILRPSPRTADGARREEREYWEAREWGGLLSLPDADEFDAAAPSCTTESAYAAAPEHTSSRQSQPRSTSPFETPARPLSRLQHLQHGTSRPKTHGTPGSSGRSRRMVSDIDAWREMQEHAWSVGMSARKGQPPRQTPDAAKASRLTAKEKKTGEAWSESKENEGVLGGLEKRQKDVVRQLEDIDRKYGPLFALAEQAGKKQ
ncbi:AGC/DMPK/GEK protein kinase [Rhodotorula toruloides ATCC 204091]|uniref:AGC/DMPK/GEK protein kinase n=1 Tax=Rhodotorula toruloides TaxID=5286 RepID=A0A2T0AJ13_RHOTO|nr:AGC/DMPK/GEK protein kinase [Rhodotorula toruloides ATCC 204091]KAK4331560.1 AGC/DMPK/GEK protein kinase [Rhodotorula toruloides]PRQ77950.1 AGC/DMPK/GEK protein kinase [Rhodotorula toruloides]